MPDVTVVIPAGSPGLSLWRSVHALAHQTTPYDSFEVVVVADTWADPDREEFHASLEVLPFCCQVLPRSGVPASAGLARNTGAEVARGRVLLFLDADMIACPDLIERHLVFQQMPNRVVLGVRDLTHESVDYGSGMWTSREALLQWKWTIPVAPDERSGFISARGQPDWGCLYSHNFSLHADLFRRSGGFDPGFVACGTEDVELGYRLHKLGASFVYAHDAIGIHQHHKRSLARINHRMQNLDHLVALHPELRPFREQVTAGWRAPHSRGRGFQR